MLKYCNSSFTFIILSGNGFWQCFNCREIYSPLQCSKREHCWEFQPVWFSNTGPCWDFSYGEECRTAISLLVIDLLLYKESTAEITLRGSSPTHKIQPPSLPYSYRGSLRILPAFHVKPDSCAKSRAGAGEAEKPRSLRGSSGLLGSLRPNPAPPRPARCRCPAAGAESAARSAALGGRAARLPQPPPGGLRGVSLPPAGRTRREGDGSRGQPRQLEWKQVVCISAWEEGAALAAGEPNAGSWNGDGAAASTPSDVLKEMDREFLQALLPDHVFPGSQSAPRAPEVPAVPSLAWG